MVETRIGKFMVTIELAGSAHEGGLGNLNKYDIVCSDEEGEVINITKGVIKFTEQGVMDGMWYKRMMEFAEKYEVLDSVLKMQEWNLWCYSKNVAMTVPNIGSEDNWQKTNENIRVWKSLIEDLKQKYC